MSCFQAVAKAQDVGKVGRGTNSSGDTIESDMGTGMIGSFFFLDNLRVRFPRWYF